MADTTENTDAVPTVPSEGITEGTTEKPRRNQYMTYPPIRIYNRLCVGYNELAETRFITTKEPTPENLAEFENKLNEYIPRSPEEKYISGFLRFVSSVNDMSPADFVVSANIPAFVIYFSGKNLLQMLGADRLAYIKWNMETFKYSVVAYNVSDNTSSGNREKQVNVLFDRVKKDITRLTTTEPTRGSHNRGRGGRPVDRNVNKRATNTKTQTVAPTNAPVASSNRYTILQRENKPATETDKSASNLSKKWSDCASDNE
jgi:hypothetical protein